MSDLISRQVLDLWNRYKPTIAVDAIEYDRELKKLLSTNLAEVGTDLIRRQDAIDYFVINVGFRDEDGYPIEDTDELRKIWTEYFEGIPSAEPKIIYCGECTKMHVDSTYHDCWCKETGKKVWVNHYCGYAERREVTE